MEKSIFFSMVWQIVSKLCLLGCGVVLLNLTLLLKSSIKKQKQPPPRKKSKQNTKNNNTYDGKQ